MLRDRPRGSIAWGWFGWGCCGWGSIALAIGFAACDVPPARPAMRAARVIATSPRDEAVDVDRRVILRVRFDRPLLPRSVDEVTVQLFSGGRRVPLSLETDPTIPGIVITPRVTLDPEARWTLRVEGVRDLDGYEAASTDVRFHTSRAATPPVPVIAPGWTDVEALLQTRCGPCHGGPTPVLGLDLRTAEGVRTTAIGVRARQVPPGASAAGAPIVAGLAGMRRIDVLAEAGRPEQSYLVYKLLGDPHILGEQMPPTEDGGTGLSSGEIATIYAWIRGGAPTTSAPE